MERTGYVYVLHFDAGLAHAHHYIGCTESPLARMRTHARGAGARITRELHARGIGFRVGQLATCTLARRRQIECELKSQKNAARYCGICNRTAKRFAATTPYPFEFDSRSVAAVYRPEVIVSERILETEEFRRSPTARMRVIEAVKQIMKIDKDALGFIPAGARSTSGQIELLDRGQIVIAAQGLEVIGYASFTVNLAATRAKIQQCVVRDEWRLQGIGRRMVTKVAELGQWERMACTVRADLWATEFWARLGFKETARRTHETSGSTLIDYEQVMDYSNGTALNTFDPTEEV